MQRITMAPLPEWGDLISAVLNAPAQDDILASQWCHSGDKPFWFSRSAWSLAVIALWRKKLLKKDCVTVWIPDYFCNSTLKPLRDLGVNLIFYPVTDQMAPDYEACNMLANTINPDIVLLVHYFGQPVPVEGMANFCKEKNAWLVEDAAHVLRAVAGIGEWGDCVLYSPHKHLPIPDGAVLVVRASGPAQLAENSLAMSVLHEARDAVLDSGSTSNSAANWWLIKRVLQRLGCRSRQSLVDFRAEIEPVELKINCPRMSALAKRLLTRLVGRLEVLAQIRELHMQNWRHVLSWGNWDGSLKPMTQQSIPYLVGFVCEQSAEAEKLFDQLQCAGLPVSTWPDLPPEVMRNPIKHRSAMALRHNRFYLPVHQTLDQSQIFAHGASLLENASSQWQVRALSFDEWDGYWRRCQKANLLQSWQYGAAKEEAEGWHAHRLLICNELTQPIALAQVLTRSLPILGGIARINRGPLLLVDLTEDSQVPVNLAALRVLLREARLKHWWMIQIAPELPPTIEATFGLQALGLNRVSGQAWGSGRLALSVDEQMLLMGLKGKWRNCLRKGEKLGVIATHHECKGEQLEMLMQSYTELQSQKGFDGLSAKLIRALAKQKGGMWEFNLFIAREADVVAETIDEPLGVLVTIRAGDTAIYLIGSTTEKGRQMQANSVLLWQAVLHAKQVGCDWFDIGGLSEATPKGIADFKQGINAVPYELVGEWR